MATFYKRITPELADFIGAQPVFFVATAPLGADGHVNLSPKGLDTFRILGTNRVAYLDMTGSGNETSAHLAENGRVTFMFCAFAGPPKIVRLFGNGRTVLPGEGEWDELRPLFGENPGTRQIIVAEINTAQTSCGYAVPLMDFVAERDTLNRWAQRKGQQGLQKYRREKNSCSLDGLMTPLGAAEQTA